MKIEALNYNVVKRGIASFFCAFFRIKYDTAVKCRVVYTATKRVDLK